MKKIYNIKLKYMRFLFIAVFAALSFTAVAATTTPAQAQLERDPRCDENIHRLQNNHGGLQRIRTDARSHEVTPQNDTTLALTCMDQQMVASARAGSIFSDTTPPGLPGGGGFPTFDSIISIGLNALGSLVGVDLNVWQDGGPDDGFRGTTLLENFDHVITDTLEELLSNFLDSLIEWAVTAMVGWMQDQITAFLGPGGWGDLINGLLGSFINDLFGFNFDCPSMGEIWTDYVIGQGPRITGDMTLGFPSELDIIQHVLGGGIAGMPDMFDTKFLSPDNAAIIQDFADDLMDLYPGSPVFPTFKEAPVFDLKPDLDYVLSLM
ncbi:MAG: hypothetical protein EA357_11630 [Micavibrio sp.]|nr:MAG: hypothetical protein EA357_11630 [Micavibrio sp.]